MSYNSKYTGAEVDAILDKANGIDISGYTKTLKFLNNVASTWVADSTYEDYGYRCDISCEGVLPTDYPEVVFDFEQAISGDYSPITETGTGIVSIWAKVNDSITVPTIIITR